MSRFWPFPIDQHTRTLPIASGDGCCPVLNQGPDAGPLSRVEYVQELTALQHSQRYGTVSAVRRGTGLSPLARPAEISIPCLETTGKVAPLITYSARIDTRSWLHHGHLMQVDALCPADVMEGIIKAPFGWSKYVDLSSHHPRLAKPVQTAVVRGQRLCAPNVRRRRWPFSNCTGEKRILCTDTDILVRVRFPSADIAAPAVQISAWSWARHLWMHSQNDAQHPKCRVWHT